MSAVPKLRFPEFDGEWEPVSSGDFYEFRNGLNYTKGMSGEEIKTLGVSDFQSNSYFDNFEKLPSVRVAGTISSKDTLADDDLVFVRSNGNKDLIGRCMFLRGVDRKASFSGFIIRGRICQNGLDALFGASLFKSSKFRTYLSVMGGGTNISNLSQSILSDFTFSIPSLPEQQKIASFLSSVDKKIDLLRQKKDGLELYKKGLMQKIFSQETRFKQDDGSDFPEWEEVTLKDAVYMKSGGTPKSTVETYYNGSIRFLSISDFSGGEKYLHSVKKRISEDGLKNSSARLFGKDTLIFAMYASVGECAILKTEAAISQAVLGMTPCSESINIEFIYYTLRNERSKFLRFVQEGTQGNLSKSIVEKFKIQLPSKKEQKKIVDYLSAVDTKIQKISSQIEQMETFKKGLLQQMFV